LVARASRETAGAVTIPRESPLYTPIFDLNNDGLWSPAEQLAGRRAALLDAADPSLYFGPPRLVRVGVVLSLPGAITP
ncbi:MAG: hypothetical protein Q8Q85_03320, partial [Gemmatimonadales bacterium]|nr:hypothetical protein [Gemmatimonadales bacterium]